MNEAAQDRMSGDELKCLSAKQRPDEMTFNEFALGKMMGATQRTELLSECGMSGQPESNDELI